jgi:hypothetical protein
LRGFARVLQEFYKSVTRVLPQAANRMNSSSTLASITGEFGLLFPVCYYESATRVLSKFYENVTRVLQECYKSVTIMFTW